MKFVVNWKRNSGDIFINGVFVRQLCFDEESVGYAVSAWLVGDTDDAEEVVTNGKS